MTQQPTLSIIAPIYNEEKNIPELIDRLQKAALQITEQYEIILVNDGSRDSSLYQLRAATQRHQNIKYLSFSRNFGHQIAVTAGLDHATGKAIVIIDGDLQDPPELIPELYQKYTEGYKVVYAQRSERQGESWFKKITATLFYRILTKITNINIPIDTGDFRLIDQQVAAQLRRMPEHDKFLRGQIAWVGFRQTSVQFIRNERKHGTTNYPLSKMLRFAIDGITAFSNFPLRFASMAGIVVSSFAFFVILYALFSKFVLQQTISGWTSLIISSMFIGGIQLLTIGIIGEYISRINNEVRNRPIYIVEEQNFVSPDPQH
ncbi:MAG TPA: glycosyltransferase family 2 protein [Chitinophagales bacterium]|jgi:dolichol-phosphate mannosyltransferase|nr:glycosyltransferase family 2 protein [Chitinophagales bacterium]HNL07526.1 glycosyltransferase family 2 protein [Chitinophagales bacterium]